MIDFPTTYKILEHQEFSTADFKLIPIRYEDRYEIMQWRNEQMYHLRQAETLTKEKQEAYFENIVSKLFEQEQPGQILFSFLKDNECIGYGGLVHINWIDKNAEISFIMKTELEKVNFEYIWSVYLQMIEEVAFKELEFHKLYTYAFDLRPHLYKVLEKGEYKHDATLKEHCLFNSVYIDVVIHSKFNNSLQIRLAEEKDLEITFKWLNDPKVREFSFNKEKVRLENHKAWFENKLKDSKCTYFIAEVNQEPVGSFRIDKENDQGIISFLLDTKQHGKGLGFKLLKQGVKKINKIYPELILIGFVMKQNKASMKLFEKLGFTKHDLGKGQLKYIQE